MAKNPIKGKRQGMGLEIKTIRGTRGTYVVFKLPDGAFHVFVETESKAAAKDCGSTMGDANTRKHWKQVWDKN